MSNEPHDPSPPLKECDMIMKGGITSGVVYPLAAVHLSKTYRFRNLGGASAGAIAAAMVAAAELGRERGVDGFATLAELPDALGTSLPELFQPSKRTAPLHRVLMAFVDKKRSMAGKIATVLGEVIRTAYRPGLIVFLVAMVPGVALSFGLDGRGGGPVDGGNVVQVALLWLPIALVLALVVMLVRFVQVGKSAMEANGFGLCDGHTQTISGTLPLTDWMDARINAAAGATGRHQQPVTFGHLWGSAAVAAFDAAVPPNTGILDLAPYQRRSVIDARIISLEVMTTNLTLRRPYRFPFEARVFHFCEACMREYFPRRVVAMMRWKSHSIPDAPRSGAEDGTISMLCPKHGRRVRSMPRPADIPIVVAARLSLSFPGLISAVPLYYVDHGREPQHVELIPVWFSDGGIASNFPMHLFDTQFPTRPTFGINLQPKDVEHGDDWVYVPATGQPRSSSMTSLPDFVHALLDTMQNWADVTQLTLPTYRQRVAEVRLTEAEGGMNLAMTHDEIAAIAARGAEAAALLDAFDLGDHQRKRFAASVAAVDDLLAGMRSAVANGFETVIAGSSPQSRVAATNQLLHLADEWNTTADPQHPLVAADLPHPSADLRGTPRL